MSVAEVLSIVINILVVAIPWILVPLAAQAWLDYRRLRYEYFDLKPMLLEIKIPPEVNKSPRAMEVILAALWQKTDGTRLEVFIDGRTRPRFSLEIVSIGGNIRYFVWTPPKFYDIVANQFYSQYPGVEVEVVRPEDDYTNSVVWDPEERFIWGTYYIKAQNEPTPIVTYKSYDLDKNPDEDVKVDPMTALIEYMGGLSYGEQAWLQIVLRANLDEEVFNKTGNAWPFKPKKGLKKQVDDFIQGIKTTSTISVNADESGQTPAYVNYDPGVVDGIKSLRDLQGKFAFETYLRGIYITKHETFNNGNISGLIAMMQQFSHAGWNALRINSYTDISDDRKDWQRAFPFKSFIKFNEGERADMEKSFLGAYKRRSGFTPPHKNHAEQKPVLMFSEEIATIYHLPGTVVTTPSLSRIEARKSDPPSNLPV